MLARGIRSYHRPTDIAEALDLVRQGATPVAGGTRILADGGERPNVLDLGALPLRGITMEDGDLRIGALATLQEIIDSPVAYTATRGLLPAACRAHSASRMIRAMATAGGESVHGAHDSEVVAALLALNAVFDVRSSAETVESPALRFLKDPRLDLDGGGLVLSLSIGGRPNGAALERLAVLPSAPSIVAVAVALSFAGEKCTRARIVLTGLDSRPARILEAEGRLEGTAGEPDDRELCMEQIRTRAVFRDDAHASAAFRREVALVLAARAIDRAFHQARASTADAPPRVRPPVKARLHTALPYFTSGDIEVNVNGAKRRLSCDARTTLLDLLRGGGFWGVKHGCETGECGACAVLLDGVPVSSCIVLACRAEGRQVETVEGMGTPDALHPIQAAFVDTGAIQCGFCTPAMEICAKALLDAVPDPDEADVRDALAGCLCRCTGYVKPVEAVMRAARAARNR